MWPDNFNRPQYLILLKYSYEIIYKCQFKKNGIKNYIVYRSFLHIEVTRDIFFNASKEIDFRAAT